MAVRHPIALLTTLAAATMLAQPAVAKDKPDPYVAKGDPVDCINIRSIPVSYTHLTLPTKA